MAYFIFDKVYNIGKNTYSKYIHIIIKIVFLQLYLIISLDLKVNLYNNRAI